MNLADATRFSRGLWAHMPSPINAHTCSVHVIDHDTVDGNTQPTRCGAVAYATFTGGVIDMRLLTHGLRNVAYSTFTFTICDTCVPGHYARTDHEFVA